MSESLNNKQVKTKFSVKKFISLSLGFSFLVMTYTGIMLYFVPKGKVAYWADWHLFGLSKSQYGDIHTTSMISFLFFAIYHVYYNWKPIVSYMKNSNKNITFFKKEFLLALIVNIIFVVGTLFMIQPFKGYLDLEENIKGYWATKCGEPPYGHAEESSLKTFCKKVGLDYKKAINLLAEKKIIVQKNVTLKNLAKINHTTPKNIYEILLNSKTFSSQKTTLSNLPSQLGRKTLKELANGGYIDLKLSIDFLKKNGLDDVTEDMKMKNIADNLGMRPKEVFSLIKKASNISK